ncbi:MAG TPA: patatin-like phospholipase family protein [Candidatus Xenobia bacterium]|nr:patatin-like phospholipase family protein [Candidatus Xenobia bacterium]
MPFGDEGVEPGIGLALSGGGYRAALFHLGALWRLNQLGLLSALDRISSVSGGSITAGCLAVRWGELQFSGGVASNFESAIVGPLRDFCTRTIDVPAALLGLLLPWKGAGHFIERSYRNHLLGDATLQSLPDRPRFVFNSTNFATAVSFRFSKPYAGDYRIGLIEKPKFRVSLAVAASSAFPPFLSPARIKPDPASFTRTKGADLYERIEFRKRLALTDGGVYDNLGLETVWNRYDTVLTSDAGAPVNPRAARYLHWLTQARRAVDITMNQARALRKRALITDYEQKLRKGAYWGIATDIRKYELPDSLPCSLQRIAELAAMRTRLSRFAEAEQCRLINWGYAVADAALRRYVVTAPVSAPAWPYPNYALS